MGCTSRKNKRAAKKAASKATSRAEKLGQKAQKSAQAGLDKFSSTVVPAVSEGAREARVKASDLVDQYFPQAQDAVRAQGERLSDFSGKLGPRAQQFRQDVQQDYLPRARRTADATNTVFTAAVAAAVDAARKELDKGQGDIRKAATAPTPKQKKGRAGKALLFVALAAAGAAAGFFAWKKTRPVEDPWAPPADFARAHYPASGSDDTDSTQVSDSVGGAEAGDVAQSLRGGTHAPSTADAADRTGDTAPKNVKVDHASGADAKGTHSAGATGTAAAGAAAGSSAANASRSDAARSEGTRSEGTRTESTGRRAADGATDQGKVIDPVENPEQNPADPEKGNYGPDGERRGTHRG